jgi:hypothetical protein
MTALGQTDALATAIVALLEARKTTFAVAITPSLRYERRTDATEWPDSSSSALVDIFPGNDKEERQGGGLQATFLASYEVHLVIQQLPGTSPESQISLLRTTRSQILQALKTLGLTVSNAVTPFRPAVLDKIEALEPYILNYLGTSVFISETILTYKAAVGC